jgi:hypothetical protein
MLERQNELNLRGCHVFCIIIASKKQRGITAGNADVGQNPSIPEDKLYTASSKMFIVITRLIIYTATNISA